MKKRKEKKPTSPMRKWIDRIILVIAVCVFFYAGFNLFTIYKANHDESKEIDYLRELVEAPTTEKELEEFKVDFDKLKEVNKAVVGWIVVEDTDISYPVVKGSDNEYYLDHTFSNYTNYAGAIFMDYRNQADLSDLNTFVYGHNVHHGTMFAELSNYMDSNFFNTHPYVYYYTPDANYKLQVFSAYVEKADSSSHRLSFAGSEDYQDYINHVKGLSRYDSGVSMTASNHMLTLYTCSYENGRNPSNTDAQYIDERYFIHCKIIEALSGEMPFERVE